MYVLHFQNSSPLVGPYDLTAFLLNQQRISQPFFERNSRKSEICEFEMSLLINNKVLRFEISVNDLMLV